ncbi:MAG: nucleoside phosphorylase [Actinomycetia bacterium]|nr:nucleoside phosphorylase [Actinomycetes bacterium]
MGAEYHLQIEGGDVAPYVLLPGDPGRVETIASLWDDARHVATNREYVTYTGTYRGVPISCTSTGIGAPSTAIALEELARAGATTFFRVGTCGTFLDDVANGDLAIFDAAMRLDGASHGYAPPEYPAVASHDVVTAAITAAKGLGYPYHVGVTRSADTFYARHPRPGSSFHGFWQSDWENHFEDLRRLNVLGAEMEASVIFVLARLWGLRAGGAAVVLDNVLRVSGESGEFDPEDQFDHSGDQIEKLARLGCETIRLIFEADTRG